MTIYCKLELTSVQTLVGKYIVAQPCDIRNTCHKMGNLEGITNTCHQMDDVTGCRLVVCKLTTNHSHIGSRLRVRDLQNRDTMSVTQIMCRSCGCKLIARCCPTWVVSRSTVHMGSLVHPTLAICCYLLLYMVALSVPSLMMRRDKT